MEVYKASFAGGEVSPEIAARADLEKYSIFCSECRNMIVQQQGGIKRRPGTIYMGECGITGISQSTERKIIPFIISVEECYVLEFWLGYMRAYTKDGVVKRLLMPDYPFELSTGLTSQDLKKLTYTQIKDSLIILDGKHIKEIKRKFSDGGDPYFTIEDYKPQYGPFVNETEEEAPQGSIARTSVVGESSLATKLCLSDSEFSQADVGKQYRLKIYIESNKISFSGNTMSELALRRTICYSSWALNIKTGWTGTVNMEYSEDGTNWNIYRTFTSSSYTSGANDNTQVAVTGSFATEDFPVYVRFTASISQGQTLNLDFQTQGFWYYLIMNVLSVDEQPVFSDFTSTATVEIVDLPDTIFDYLPSYPTNSRTWAVGRPAWTTERGMPRAVAQFQQRLVFGGTETEPDVIWATETGEKYSFFKNVEPKSADSITTSVIDSKSSKILALSSLRSLLVFCMGAEFCLSSDVFTPSAAGFNKQSEYGFLENSCFEVVGNRIVFPQNMGKVLRGFAYDYSNDNYSGQDISIYVKHFFKKGRIKDLAYQQEPNTTLWVVLDNGELLSCTYLEEQNVLAWARHDIGGKALSVCSIYGEDQNDIFLIVQREIGGTDKYFVEKLAKDNVDIQTSCYMDCSYVYSHPTTAKTSFPVPQFAGLDKIDVLADGKYLKDIPLLISDGTVYANGTTYADISGIMPDGAKNIIAGLRYKSSVKTLPINTDSQNVLLNKKIRFPYVDVCLLDSVECDVGFSDHKKEKILPIFKQYNTCPESQSGWKRVPLNASNELGACAEISIDSPYPLNVLGLIIEAV